MTDELFMGYLKLGCFLKFNEDDWLEPYEYVAREIDGTIGALRNMITGKFITGGEEVLKQYRGLVTAGEAQLDYEPMIRAQLDAHMQ